MPHAHEPLISWTRHRERILTSEDGGKTFERYRTPHGDHHDLWIDPDNNQRMIVADDGGAQISNDDAKTLYSDASKAQNKLDKIVDDLDKKRMNH